MLSQSKVRLLFAAIVVLSSLSLVTMNWSQDGSTQGTFREQASLPESDRTPLASETTGATVVTSQRGYLVVIGSDGKLRFYTDRFDGYFDVDPVPDTRSTVIYAAIKALPSGAPCEPVDGDRCARQIVAKTNFSTGKTTTLHSRIDPRSGSSEWHDVDRISKHKVLVADMYRDEVFVVNTSTGITTWRWELQQYLSLSTGGKFPDDWAHINDVELLEDGRIMVSLRNQDQVIFLYRNGTVQESWTLGEDNNRSILYEQHNPDYIPEENGGPAIVLADSERNRVVEFQSQDGNWVETWHWQDRRLDWPRDADRLPNGHTLITDSLGGRVIEVNSTGGIIWQLPISKAYDAERLSTGPESAEGPSAVNAGIQSREPAEAASAAESLESEVRSMFPVKVIHGLKHVTPGWMGFYDFGLSILLAGTVLIWAGLEVYWADVGLRSPIVRG